MRTELYRIEGPWSGRLAIAPRPRGGDWLEEEIHSWRQAGVAVVVSTLTAEEVSELGLSEEKALCQANGLEYLNYPIADRGVPTSANAAANFIRDLESRLQGGQGVVIHCRQGVGRSALLAASLLTVAGVDADIAFERIRSARSCPVPDTAAQREWVVRFARDFLAATRGK